MVHGKQSEGGKWTWRVRHHMVAILYKVMGRKVSNKVIFGSRLEGNEA